MAASRESSS
ncbi:hypothetical protein LIER_43605 [Lithospermum erythrorhizon]|uniref:Uncharacterized protein n=1 Tax=Lithospermum erythrorhizon TaxID=34254 RepID=A0AAV3QEG1_LITER